MDGEGLSVHVEYTIVDGPEAAAWRSRQAAAIKALLAWAAGEPDQYQVDDDRTPLSTERRRRDP